MSYMQLIQMALNSVPDKRMNLQQIYTWIEKHFPYFKLYARKGWKVRTFSMEYSRLRVTRPPRDRKEVCLCEKSRDDNHAIMSYYELTNPFFGLRSRYTTMRGTIDSAELRGVYCTLVLVALNS